MFDKLKKLFKKKPEAKTTPKPKAKTKLSPKEEATKNNEPYIAILSMEVDPENIHEGAIEFDWNDKFILNLVRAGYKIREDDTDNDMVDRWWQTVCRNTVLEMYEQEQADPVKRDKNDLRREVRSRNIGNGRSEVS